MATAVPGTQPPPLPAGPTPHEPPPPKKSRTGCVIALIIAAVCVVVIVPIIGILAAIAVPAYNDYLARTKVTMAMSQSLPLRISVASFYSEHQRCPDPGEERIAASGQVQWGGQLDASIGQTAAGNCTIEITLREEDSALDGKSFHFEYDVDWGMWRCKSDLEARLLPQDCRD